MARLTQHDLLCAVMDLPEHAVRSTVQAITQFFFVEDGVLDFNKDVPGADAVDKVIEVLDTHGINEERVEQSARRRLKSATIKGMQKAMKPVCPKCGSRRLKSVVGGYLERGPYIHGGHDRERPEAIGYRCKDCNATFCMVELDEAYDKATDCF